MVAPLPRSKAKGEALREIAQILKGQRELIVYELSQQRHQARAAAQRISVLRRKQAELQTIIRTIEAGLKVDLEVR